MIDKKVIGVWSPKGGCGKSFIATNIGAYCASKGCLTGIIEVDRQHSSDTSILNIDMPKGKSLRNSIYSEEEMKMVKNFHENPRKHRDLFLLALNLDDKVDDLHSISKESINRLYNYCRERFNLLIIDMPSSYLEYTSYLGWYFVDELFVVIDNDINSVYALRKYLKQFQELNIDIGKISLIVNKNIGVIDKKAIELMTNLKVYATIPFSKKIISDMNNSKTIFQSYGTLIDWRIKKVLKGVGEDLLREHQGN